MKYTKWAGLLGSIMYSTGLFAYPTPSQTIDHIFAYFEQIGHEQKIEEAKQKQYFTSDFKMIIHGKAILNNNANALTQHFEHIIKQIKKLDIHLHEKICGKDYCVMRYDLTEPTRGITHVMAIFKFRNGKCYEMNEVFHVQNPTKSIDVSK